MVTNFLWGANNFADYILELGKSLAFEERKVTALAITKH